MERGRAGEGGRFGECAHGFVIHFRISGILLRGIAIMGIWHSV